jgi:uncharacterized membrane protein YfcA
MFEYIWLVPLGFVAGILGSMIGLGGGIIVVPILTFMGFPPTIAASNSLFAAFSNASASTISYARQKRIDYSTGIKFGLATIPGTIIGAYISSDVTPEIFKILFGIILVISSVYIFLKSKIQPRKIKDHSKLIMIFCVGASFLAGIISSFFGIGGGIIFVPLMITIMGMGMKRTAATSQFILLFASFSGLITHSILGHSEFYQALLLAVGAFAGGMIGARLSVDIKEKYLQIIASVAIISAAIKLFIDSFEGIL